MPIITAEVDFNGVAAKISRLGLQPLVDEAVSALGHFKMLVREERHANGTRGLRQSIDQGFDSAGGWSKLTVGGIDWKKTNSLGASIGVEVQVSGRSDMLAVDIMHLREDITNGTIDVGIIIVPDDRLSKFLTDRTPNLATALKHVENRARELPIKVIAFAADGVGDPLPKMRTNLGKL